MGILALLCSQVLRLYLTKSELHNAMRDTYFVLFLVAEKYTRVPYVSMDLIIFLYRSILLWEDNLLEWQIRGYCRIHVYMFFRVGITRYSVLRYLLCYNFIVDIEVRLQHTVSVVFAFKENEFGFGVINGKFVELEVG